LPNFGFIQAKVAKLRVSGAGERSLASLARACNHHQPFGVGVGVGQTLREETWEEHDEFCPKSSPTMMILAQNRYSI
jgi:hypothetical protein